MSKYSRDFKLEAVNAYLSQNDSQQQIAAVFAICPRQLRDWVSMYQRYGAAALAPCEQHREYSTEFKLTVLNYKRQHPRRRCIFRFHRHPRYCGNAEKAGLSDKPQDSAKAHAAVELKADSAPQAL